MFTFTQILSMNYSTYYSDIMSCQNLTVNFQHKKFPSYAGHFTIFLAHHFDLFDSYYQYLCLQYII